MINEFLRTILLMRLILLPAAALAFAGSHGGYTVAGIPIYVICVATAFLIQWAAFIPAHLIRTEKFYDLIGSTMYITVVALAIMLCPVIDERSVLLFCIICTWAIRLGLFLFTRICSAGEDRRFREIKKSFTRFLLTWTLLGLWVTFSLAAALAAITSTIRLELDTLALMGFLIWLFGFSFEVVADRQKSRFNTNPKNKDRFIDSGLWAWSRHPNYFGEIILWIGVALIAMPVLKGWQWLTMISPIFVVVVLTKISGIPLLEARADKKWGGQIDYETYKANTPTLIPEPALRRDD
jgi:steroid 5-alpha reductase family enzyme